MSARVAVTGLVVAALAGLAALALCAPGYLTALGFPLDDAWIHAVYGRELARSGMLAYNPGVPATGSTAPFWSAVVAVPHLFGEGPGVVLAIKLIGFVCHVATALVLYAALGDRDRGRDPWRLAGALLVMLQPDLVSASVSGMEAACAALAAVAIVYVAGHAGAAANGAVAAAAVLVRPELAVVSATVAALSWGPSVVSRQSSVVSRSPHHFGRSRPGDRRPTTDDRRPITGDAVALRRAVGALAGTTLAALLLAARNCAVSGWPLPATFYAKVGGGPAPVEALRMGFGGVLRTLPPLDSLLLVGAVLGIAALLVRERGGVSRAAASFVAGVVFCATSFILVAPIDPGAFYHQRYVLPAVPLLLGPLPLLLREALGRACQPRLATAVAGLLVLALAVGAVRAAPQRFVRLASDARNIDDVQVQVGRHLAAADSDAVVWAVDAGAVRYFGNAAVVDMLGLNTPELLGPGAQAFLDAHPPRWVEVVPTWSALRTETSDPPAAAVFAPTTPYTVTGFPDMAEHRLVDCSDGSAGARFGIRGRVFGVACGSGARTAAVRR